jgi:hypothetical protein
VRFFVSVMVVAVLTAGLGHAATAATPTPYPKSWAFLITSGWNRSSSPVIADIDADGSNEVVFGHQDGMLRAYDENGSLEWATRAVPGLASECNAQSTPSAIDSSPAVADLDADGIPEVIVGVGSAWHADQNGSVIVFDGVSGAIEWAFDHSEDAGDLWPYPIPVDDGWCEGTFATPAIGDVDGDGYLDIVFGSWDWLIWAVDRFGQPLPGFPVDNADTVWSSPALADVDGDGDAEIFIGGDSTAHLGHLGGWFRAIDYVDGQPQEMWTRTANEVFHSSPAIADINGDGRLEAIVGMGDNWKTECTVLQNPRCSPGDGSHNTRLWAFHLDDGTDVAGFPVDAGGTIRSSPAIGDVDGDGALEIVVGAWDHKVYVWNGDGTLAWSTTPQFDFLGSGVVNASPVIGDLDGDGDQDIAVGTSLGLALLDGRNGANLEASVAPFSRVSFGWSHESAAAIGILNGKRHIVTVGFDTPGLKTRVAAFELPNSSVEDDWPMFRRTTDRSGSTDPLNLCGLLNSGRFCDVAGSAYYADGVQWMVDNEITTGISSTLYGPNLVLTRAQMVTFLWRQEGSQVGYPAHGFGDVSDSSYFSDAVAWAKAEGITTGTSAITFSPSEDVTRAQLVTLLWRRAGGILDQPPHGFIDVPENRYYSVAVAWAKAEGITTGTSAITFSPSEDVTRAQAAAMLYREAVS